MFRKTDLVLGHRSRKAKGAGEARLADDAEQAVKLAVGEPRELLLRALGEMRMERAAEEAADPHLPLASALVELEAREACRQQRQAFASRNEEAETRQRAANVGRAIGEVHGRARAVDEPPDLRRELAIERLERVGDRVGGAGEDHGIGGDHVVVVERETPPPAAGGPDRAEARAGSQRSRRQALQQAVHERAHS